MRTLPHLLVNREHLFGESVLNGCGVVRLWPPSLPPDLYLEDPFVSQLNQGTKAFLLHSGARIFLVLRFILWLFLLSIVYRSPICFRHKHSVSSSSMFLFFDLQLDYKQLFWNAEFIYVPSFMYKTLPVERNRLDRRQHSVSYILCFNFFLILFLIIVVFMSILWTILLYH